MRISPEAGSEIRLQITPPIRSSPVEEWFDADAYEHETMLIIQPEPELELNLEPEPELSLITTPVVDHLGDPVIRRIRHSTQNARIEMSQKYSKRHEIQDSKIGDIVSIKVPREDRTASDNRRLFARILDDSNSYRLRSLPSQEILNA